MAKEQVAMNFPALIEAVESAGRMVANAITPRAAAPGHDEPGGTVESLTEAVMGVTAGLCRIAAALHDLAEAICESADDD